MRSCGSRRCGRTSRRSFLLTFVWRVVYCGQLVVNRKERHEDEHDV